jgi:D-ribose pyranase
MKKNGVLNKDISEVVASMGHTDSLMICDAGLPIPQNTRRIDLALKQGVPGFIDVAEVIASELKIEKIVVAEEMKTASPKTLEAIKKTFAGIEIKFVSHEKLKELSSETRAIIRTGEFTPYANVIVYSGVVF